MSGTQDLQAQLEGLDSQIARFMASSGDTDKNISEIRAEVNLMREGMSDFRMSLDETDKWAAEIEAKAVRRGETGYDGRNNLLEAIQTHDRKHVRLAEAFGYPHPVKHAAQALWLRNMLCQNAVDITQKRKLDMVNESRLLERAFGEELISHAAQGETTTGTGIELILTPVEAEILRQIKDNSYIRQVARLLPMVSKTHQIPSLDTDVVAFFTAEGVAVTDSMVATNWSQKALTAKKIAGIATISNELLQDNIVGLPEFLFGAIAEQIGRLEDTESLEGTGTNFTGVNAASGVNTIAAGTNGDSVTLNKLIAAIFTAADVDSRQNAAYFMSPLEAIKVYGLVDTNGQPIFTLPIGSTQAQLPAGARGALFNYPVFVHSGILTNRTKGTGANLTNIYFGNWKKLIIGDLLGLTFFTDPYSLSTTDSVRVRVTKRTGCVVGVPKSFTVVKDLFTT